LAVRLLIDRADRADGRAGLGNLFDLEPHLIGR
jgi:hypothetical protein